MKSKKKPSSSPNWTFPFPNLYSDFDDRRGENCVYLNDTQSKEFPQRHSRESGNPERKTGFRVKPGMTDLKVICKW